ncbi:MAG: NUDIX hydrolase [Candidatus Saccharimonadales bacterium]
MQSDQDKLQPWQTTAQEIVFENKWFKIRKRHMQTPTGAVADYFIHEAPDSVICVCVSDDNTVLIERQYRPPVEKISVDYPAGGIEADDTSTEAAIRRELLEEVGFTVETIRQLAVMDSEPGFSTKRTHVFLAKGSINKEATPEETEHIVAEFVSPSEILALIARGEMACTFCLSATFLAFKELGWLTPEV